MVELHGKNRNVVVVVVVSLMPHPTPLHYFSFFCCTLAKMALKACMKQEKTHKTNSNKFQDSLDHRLQVAGLSLIHLQDFRMPGIEDGLWPSALRLLLAMIQPEHGKEQPKWKGPSACPFNGSNTHEPLPQCLTRSTTISKPSVGVSLMRTIHIVLFYGAYSKCKCLLRVCLCIYIYMWC